MLIVTVMKIQLSDMQVNEEITMLCIILAGISNHIQEKTKYVMLHLNIIHSDKFMMIK